MRFICLTDLQVTTTRKNIATTVQVKVYLTIQSDKINLNCAFFSAPTKSSALSKANAIASAYESKPRPELIRMLSDSSMDMSLDTETGPIQFGDAASLIPGKGRLY